MKEIKAIIQAYDQLDKITTQAALATVVRVEDSSYRRTGARMLVLDNGTWVGGISGGCLEGDALKQARFAIAKSSSTLITYDTTEDDEHQIGIGLGCNGIIDVLFTPLDFNDKYNAVEVLKICVNANRQTHILLTINNLLGNWGNIISAGKVINYKNSESLTFFEDTYLENSIEEQINLQLKKGHSAPHIFEVNTTQKISIFIEILPPEIHLILFGHQYDVFPLSKLIKEIGWRVSIVANVVKVNKAIASIVDEIIAPENFNNCFIDEHTAIILMSHDYKTDKNNLPKILTTNAPYIGMLGPRVRSEKIFRELLEEGQEISNENLERIFAPVGLDIGAVSPEEIALSILAEIRAFFSKRTGNSLRLREISIHERNK